jgi:hypothetical protein
MVEAVQDGTRAGAAKPRYRWLTRAGSARLAYSTVGTSRFADSALEHADLMTQGQILQREGALGPEE